VETRPLWRLQLRSGGLGTDPGSSGFGPAPTTGAGGVAGLASGSSRSQTYDVAPESGTVFGYQYGIGDDVREAVGINMQVGSDIGDAYERLLLQPGVEYQTPLTSGLQLNARVFSTYASDTTSADRKDLSRNGGDAISGGGFRDIGLGLGLGYSLTEQWVIHTQAGVARQLGDGHSGSKPEDPKALNQFFGGVVVNYRF